MKVKKKSGAKVAIPTSSMSDIVFLLLLFFMVSTTFKQFQGLKVRLPASTISEKVPTKRNITHVYADRSGIISIDDKLMEPYSVHKIVNQKLMENPRLIFSLKIDEKLQYGRVNTLLEELRKGNGLKVNFSTTRRSNKG